MDRTLTVALLYGGRSVEHVVSCRSAATVAHELHLAGHTVIPIAIDREGRWSVQTYDPQQVYDRLPSDFRTETEVTVRPGSGFMVDVQPIRFDTCFPVTHGTGGEDGMLQGLLELARVPYVGCNPAASSIGMHKRTAKLYARHVGVPTLESLCVTRADMHGLRSDAEGKAGTLCRHISELLGTPVIVKPEDGGSSVGVQVLHDCTVEHLLEALGHAMRFTGTVLVEPYVEHRMELECAVLCEGATIRVSEPGQVVDPTEAGMSFLSYERKYLDVSCAFMRVPAPIDASLSEQTKAFAVQIARAIGVEGYARVDFLMDTTTGAIWFNEINTLPGMTAKSHFPVLAASMGYDWPRLLDRLLSESLSREAERNVLLFKDVE